MPKLTATWFELKRDVERLEAEIAAHDAEVRDRALEEAATFADTHCEVDPGTMGPAIRALKGKP